MLIRNYRPDGSLFWNEILLQPLRNSEGTVTHWVGYCRDSGGRMKTAVDNRTVPGLPALQREDRLTGLNSRPYFEELLKRDWQLAQRDSHAIGLVMLDIDDLQVYNDKFERTGGDAVIRRVARVIGGSYRRGGDVVGYWGAGTFVVLIQGDAAERAAEYARVVSQRVRDLLIHHPARRGRAVFDGALGYRGPRAASRAGARSADQRVSGCASACEEAGAEQYRDRWGVGLSVTKEALNRRAASGASASNAFLAARRLRASQFSAPRRPRTLCRRYQRNHPKPRVVVVIPLIEANTTTLIHRELRPRPGPIPAGGLEGAYVNAIPRCRNCPRSRNTVPFNPGTSSSSF